MTSAEAMMVGIGVFCVVVVLLSLWGMGELGDDEDK
jgi:hypothetical protein